MIVYVWNRETVCADERTEAVADFVARTGTALGSYRKDEKNRPTADGGYLSISHTAGVCVMAIGLSPLGIDIERRDRATRVGLPAIGVWTQYEAYAKYYGIGVREAVKTGRLPQSLIREIDISSEYICHVCTQDQEVTILDAEEVLGGKR